MFEVLAQPRTSRARALGHAGPTRPAIIVSGVVDYDKLAVFAHLEGQRVTCTSGRIWLTIENDPNDYVLASGQRLVIPSPGKVVVGGRGSYCI
jgi:hypothetical protein